MTKTLYPATLLCDFYKVSHKDQYPIGTETVYSTWIARSNKYFPRTDKVVAFGFQAFIKKYLINYFNEHFFSRPKEEVVAEYVRYIKFTLGVENPDATHIAELHDLGYLPITVKAIKEGILVPIKVPMLVVENTNPKFFWVTNYLETIISNEIWLPSTSATIAFEYRKLLNKYAMKTTGDTSGVIFQGHDFSMRGMGAFEASVNSGAGHLLSFVGTDTIPAIAHHEAYYNANIETEMVGTSIPATEHSVMCAYGQTDEFELFKHLMTNVYPKGFFSVVSDTWDFWKVVGEYLPKLKNEIMERDGRVVIRPDSGNPVDIIVGKRTIEEFGSHEEAKGILRDKAYDEAEECCGEDMTGDDEYSYVYKVDNKYFKMTFEPFYNRYDKRFYYVDGFDKIYHEEYEIKIEDIGLIEALWNIFGGTVTEQGYKVLDGHIGAIYGDSITIDRAEAILRGLEAKGFASTNVVFGIGSFTYQFNTRDTFSFAMKATHVQVDGEERMIFKNPKTDDGTKKSLRGRVVVTDEGGEIIAQDGLNLDSEAEVVGAVGNMLETVFENGKLVREQSLKEIRNILHNGQF
ncbi:nicotinamide phosphoribosyl transferase [Bacillus phage vB_BcoS-136]|uniref:Nicotinamide phosphoribosyltransferase n=1 Tax=Bacillus phage vB_BcoS-136 TaxID=2419619 RepID=A0A3G3BVK6_9CAUD|nr:nicotinamide phosphoribosyl transferase [Bacillus phage vB_BcoS-136]AYP68295.1 nicotinamide phosphoribosyl transferase [Bacillus phage vB_BcoS-136]